MSSVRRTFASTTAVLEADHEGAVPWHPENLVESHLSLGVADHRDRPAGQHAPVRPTRVYLACKGHGGGLAGPSRGRRTLGATVPPGRLRRRRR